MRNYHESVRNSVKARVIPSQTSGAFAGILILLVEETSYYDITKEETKIGH